jgi:hypothetical protein
MDTQQVSQSGSKKEILFPNGNRAQLVAPPAGTKVADILHALGIEQPKALIMIFGGAAGLDDAIKSDEALKSCLTQLFSRGIARAAANTGALIIDGGTQSGVMALMGQGVADRGRKSVLLGVAPAGKVTYPGGPAEGSIEDGAPLDPNHSHFVLVESDEWGGETDTMFELAKALGKEIPVVTMLVGSELDGIAKDEVLHSVRQGWPVIVIEGSGRLADRIAKLRKKAEKKRRKCASTADPVMAEIIDEGSIHLFPLEGPVAELEQLISGQLRCDPTLEDAWRRFAVYDQNAIPAQKRFLRLRKWILALGVVATVLALVHSTLEPIEIPGVVQVNFYLNFLVIATPILVSLLLAGSVKFERGVSWVLLRNSAEAIKKEIYRYRARVEIYSQKKQEKKDEIEESREVKLARKVKRVGERLMKTQVNRSGLTPYEGTLPPQYGASSDDDGFSDLEPEKYLAWRLEDQLNWYQKKALVLDKQLQRLQWLIYILGGVGTFLAAVGLEIWIAVTIALVGALTTFLEFKRVETTLTAYNQAATDLDSIRTWWRALPDEDKKGEKKQENFEKLVKNTEAVIQSEHAGWVQEMRDALAELYGEAEASDETTES